MKFLTSSKKEKIKNHNKLVKNKFAGIWKIFTKRSKMSSENIKLKEQRRAKRYIRLDPFLKRIFLSTARDFVKLILNANPKKIKRLPEEIQFIKQLRPDILFIVFFKNKKFILHIEFQAQSDKKIPQRMLLYKVAVKNQYDIETLQAVLWFGKGKPPPSTYKDHATTHRFLVIDMRRIGLNTFLKSKNPLFVVLGLISARSEKEVELIKRRLKELSSGQKEYEELLKNLAFYAEMLKIKFRKPMIPKIQIPIEKLTSYKVGFSKGKREGKREGIKEGLKEAILLDFDTKFSNGESKIKNMKKELKKVLDRTDDLKKLKKIKFFILRADTPDEFIKKTKEYLKIK